MLSIHYLTLKEMRELLTPKPVEMEILINEQAHTIRLLLVPSAGECQEFIKELKTCLIDCATVPPMIDLLIDKVPASRPIIAKYAQDVLKKRASWNKPEENTSSKCPVCGAKEIPYAHPFTAYSCGSTGLDQRPGTFKQGCMCQPQVKP